MPTSAPIAVKKTVAGIIMIKESATTANSTEKRRIALFPM
jgi:hypothetical protein